MDAAVDGSDISVVQGLFGQMPASSERYLEVEIKGETPSSSGRETIVTSFTADSDGASLRQNRQREREFRERERDMLNPNPCITCLSDRTESDLIRQRNRMRPLEVVEERSSSSVIEIAVGSEDTYNDTAGDN